MEQCAGYGVADDTTGERLAMAVRLRAGTELPFDAMVDGLVAAGAAKWKIPEELVVWDELFPETASGKVQRTLLEAPRGGPPAVGGRSPHQRMTNSRGVVDLVDAVGDRLRRRASESVTPVVMPRNTRDTRPPPTEYA